ncbi:ABC transporter substrate-binding protein [Piscirickettsia salmonis]|uniref:substrate-binding periplasmic protein n=1 Tax=Piscirickettsia salmonis TaxID=1238 RepID=UPI000308B407|nr:transporter substrate-binding domain-containing protein [Piscirickettsia salmonis]APS45553.1 ABC transporter substrate-binding protein [Piscirickettsia salmonis]APS46210.1 ABC transporter substrate-binding protein [Piscirickettsia salmonis]APS50141.1 ABC transporter substrate-binding protein [Piscirickettsia salmonis]APS53341.1 ABC transporter substrate-binding protein [Piscirickettsia salmonis]APS55824.1 ABC transporter substrate-binding protein [Piscirickettsia salmonis]
MRALFLLFIFLLPSAGVVAFASALKQVRLVSIDYPPYYGPKLANQGVITEIVKASFKASGIVASVDFATWARAKSLAQQGLYDAIFTMWYSPEREKHFIFSKGLMPNILGFYSLESSRVKKGGLASLEGYKIGVVRGYANPAKLMSSPLHLYIGNSDEENIRLLINKRLDVILIDKYVGQYLYYKNFKNKEKIRWLNPALVKKMQYLAAPRSSSRAREVITAFNQGLKKLRKSGEYDRLLEQLDALQR